MRRKSAVVIVVVSFRHVHNLAMLIRLVSNEFLMCEEKFFFAEQFYKFIRQDKVNEKFASKMGEREMRKY
jgi:hypothetical protein